MPTRPRKAATRRHAAFTLLELLIVVGAIATLIAILIPSLARSREHARVVKCMANQRGVVQAVHAFAAEHQGYGQVLWGGSQEWVNLYAYRPLRYEYEAWPTSLSGPFSPPRPIRAGQRMISPWPTAYADYIGAPSLRNADSASDRAIARDAIHSDELTR